MNTNQVLFTVFYALALLIQLSMAGILESMRKFPCYQRKYQLKRFYCKNEFFLSFREKPFQSCSEKAKEMITCRVAVDKECLMLADKNNFLYHIYKKISMKPDQKRAAKQYCHEAGLITPFVDSTSVRKIGCTDDYFVGKSACIEDFKRKWRHNRGSRLLCDEYNAMEKCIDDELYSHCTVKAIEKIKKHGKSMLSALTSGLNPFCDHKRDV